MKKIFNFIIVFLLIIASSFTNQQKPDNTNLPDLSMLTTAGKTINTNQLKGKNILVLFLPDCDHCQRQASEFKKEMTKFKGYNFYFISSATIDQLKKFAGDYKLAGIPTVSFAQTSAENIRTKFGYINTPSIYVYSEKGKLVKHFNGETPVKEILTVI